MVNFLSKEIHCKIVYFGPGLGGKTTNILQIYQKFVHQEGKLLRLNTENERTLFFDFLPLELGEIRGMKTRFHLYSVPGQNFYQASKRVILKGLDGIVFVADSQLERMDENLESMKNLKDSMENFLQTPLENVPGVMQWNKRDLPNITSIQELEEKLNPMKWPSLSACAQNGEGVFETLKLIGKLTLAHLKIQDLGNNVKNSIKTKENFY